MSDILSSSLGTAIIGSVVPLSHCLTFLDHCTLVRLARPLRPMDQAWTKPDPSSSRSFVYRMDYM